MRFRTRAFLYFFVPCALLLAGSFWMIQRLVQSTVREGLRRSLLENHKELALVLSKNDLQSSRFLKVVGENAALKAGVQLMLAYPKNAEARRTVEDQLGELSGHMGFALLAFSGPDNAPLAAVLDNAPLDSASVTVSRNGLMLLNNMVYQIASVAIDQAGENLGTLAVGEVFDFSQFTAPTVLIHGGHVLKSNIKGVAPTDVESAIRQCAGSDDCDVRLHGANYISLPMQSASLGTGYQLRSLQNLDSAVAPVQAMLKQVFGGVALGAMLIAMIVGVASAESIVRPLATVVEHLRKAEKTGDLTEFHWGSSPVPEIRKLIDSFNRAAVSIREGRENLTLAYVEFVQSLASALDARDPYTAGHSHRVSEMSRALAGAMQLPADIVERIRVGALLHDIGKIGVPDEVLRKPGRLTDQEFALVMEHPVIGRRILEGVHGFSQYLPAVELHHENWDGSGYPHGRSGTETPVDARIIHVADAYDAMTTDRPYRVGMTHDQALHALAKGAGTQFDPEIVSGFAALKMAETNRQAALC